MPTLDQVKHFLYEESTAFIQTLQANSKPIFGLMNSTQVINHMEASLRLPLLNMKLTLTTEPERIELARQFLYTEKPIREGAKKPDLYGDFEKTSENIAEAKAEFQKTLEAFRRVAEAGELSGTHPFFGDLNNEEWLRFEEKHLRHHMVQFGFGS
jgi:hydroxymethylglutaryl-CoA reductase